MYPIINDKLKDTPFKICLAVTGGGTGSIDKLLKYGGGSSTLIDAYVPYDIQRLTEFLGKEPAKCCHMDTARLMATEAYKRACTGNDRTKVLGVGVTSKLRKVVNERSGREHTIHVAIQGLEFTETFDFVLGPTAKSIRVQEMGRVEEEDLCSDTVIMCIAVASGLKGYLKELKALYGDDFTHIKAVDLYNTKDILYGDINFVSLNSKPQAPCVFSGSFNPIHRGHLDIIKLAKEKYGTVDLEISIGNVDKAPLDYLDIVTRMAKLSYHSDLINNVWLTDMPLFEQKSNFFESGTHFIVGGDTLERLDNIKYYSNRASLRNSVFGTYRENDNKFYVFNRQGASFNYLSKELLSLSEFSSDYEDDGISSSQLRGSK